MGEPAITPEIRERIAREVNRYLLCAVGFLLAEVLWCGAIWFAPHPTPAHVAALPPSFIAR